MLSSRARIFSTPRQVFFWLSAREAFFVSFVSFYQQTFSVCLILVHLSIQILTLEIHSFKPLRYISLRKKCPFSELLWSAFFPHLPTIRRGTEYLSVFSLNAGKCGKNADQNNSKHGHFLHSVYECNNWYKLWQSTQLAS